jgi:hypothetical protein
MSESSSSYAESDDDESDYSSTTYLNEDLTPAQKSDGLYLSLEMVQMLRVSTSEGNVFNMLPQATVEAMTPPSPRRHSGGTPTASGMVYAMQTKSPMESHHHHAASEANIPKPKDTLNDIFVKQGLEVKYRSSSDMPDFFVESCVSSHTFELMTAVRQNDLSVIRKLHESGHNLQCSNKFQESVIHTVARRGLCDILTYLTKVAGCSVRVCCDGGRTALHDACWTGNPSWECLRIVLELCPDLLLVMDKRGLTPLDYIPKDVHEEWNEWLLGNVDLLTPRELIA